MAVLPYLMAVALAWLSLMPAADAATWDMPPKAYQYEQMLLCDQAKPPPPAIYNVCVDQMPAFAEAIEDARRQNKSLLVVFGATWCPSCRSLKAVLSPDVLAANTSRGRLSERVHLIEIPISTLAGGRVTAVPSGMAVLRAAMVGKPTFKPRAVPFYAVINPLAKTVVLRNLDDLEPVASGSWNTGELSALFAAADIEARGGATAPSEPGWLRRKWQRLWR